MLAKEDAASSSHHGEPIGDGQRMLDQCMGDDELLYIIDCLQDGVLAFALVCTAFRDAVSHYLRSVHIMSTCAEAILPSKPGATHLCTSVTTF